MEACLFCNIPEQGHPSKVDYLCSACVQNFLGIDKDYLQVLFEKAKAKDNLRILRGLRLFFGK